MTTLLFLRCVTCGARYAEGEANVCPACGTDKGILDAEYDLPRAAAALTREAIARRPLSIWRYRELLPLPEGAPALPADTGWTPLLDAPRLAAALEVGRVRIKDDTRMASASFKDRASAIAVSRALAEGAREIACASTGNAASSLARCAAVAGLRANIFVPAAIPEGKLAQLLIYGARVFKVEARYDIAWRLCMDACERFGWYNRNCAVNPYLVEGKKTGGLEVAEQCAGDPPGWVAVSVGDGCTVAGIGKGLREARETGLVSWRARLLAVQAAGAAPLAQAFEAGAENFDVVAAEGEAARWSGTFADSINCPAPRNGAKALRAVRESGGHFVTVSDEEIREAARRLGRLTGVFAEPAGAAALAGVAAARRAGILGADADVVVFATGHGLKDLPGALRAAPAPHVIPPRLDAVAQILATTPPPGNF